MTPYTLFWSLAFLCQQYYGVNIFLWSAPYFFCCRIFHWVAVSPYLAVNGHLGFPHWKLLRDRPHPLGFFIFSTAFSVGQAHSWCSRNCRCFSLWWDRSSGGAGHGRGARRLPRKRSFEIHWCDHEYIRALGVTYERREIESLVPQERWSHKMMVRQRREGKGGNDYI